MWHLELWKEAPIGTTAPWAWTMGGERAWPECGGVRVGAEPERHGAGVGEGGGV
jgi:hypothetical protein